MSKSNAVFKGAYNTCLGQLKVGEKLPSEAGLATQLGISRTTVRTVLGTLSDAGIVAWDGSSKLVLRQPTAADYFPDSETDPLQAMIERSFMRRVLSKGASRAIRSTKRISPARSGSAPPRCGNSCCGSAASG